MEKKKEKGECPFKGIDPVTRWFERLVNPSVDIYIYIYICVCIVMSASSPLNGLICR